MVNKKKKSVRIKITYWLIALSLIPLLSITLTIYFQRVHLITEATQDKLTAIRDLKVSELNRWYNEQHSDVLGLTLMQPFRRLEVLKYRTSQAVRDSAIFIVNEIMKDNKNVHKNLMNLYYIDSDKNTIVLSTNSESIGINLMGKEYYKNIIENGGHYHSNIYFSELDKNNTMTFANPVYCNLHNKAHLIGYLFANIDLENEFYPLLLDKGGLGKTGETLIVDENLIAQSELRWYYHAPLKFKIDAKPAMLAAAGSTGTIVSKDYRGEKIIAAYTHLPEQNWGFICKQDINELNVPISIMLKGLIIIFIIFSLSAIVISLLLGKSITTPLIEIDNVITRIRAGDYSARSIADTNDEFGSLSEMINEMAESTEQRFYVRKSIAALTTAVVDKSSLHDYSESLLKKLSEICGAAVANFYILDENTTKFVAINSIGKKLDEFKSVSLKYPREEFKTALKQKRANLIKKIPKNCIFRISDNNIHFVPKDVYVIPIISDSIVVALVGLATESSLTKSNLNILQLSETIINATYTSLLALERSRIFSEQLFRINTQLKEKSDELSARADELNKQRLILEDATKKVQNKNEELEIQRRVVERANTDLESFSYSVSHDLRAPLRAIRGFADILLDEYAPKLGEEGTRLTQVIIDNTNKMNALIKDLLELSRVGRKSRNISNINMKEMANSIYHEVVDGNTMEKIELKIGNLPKIKGDPNLLRQVWANLIANAIKFSSINEKIKIHIYAKKENGKIIYSIKDNGVGFDMEYQDKLFGVFQRLHSEEEFEGTGVGLALVKQIINKHNGEVWAESKLGKGSIFHFSLPKD